MLFTCDFLGCLASLASAQDLPALFNVTGVASNDVLNLRRDPNASGMLLGSLPHDAKAVEVVQTNTEGKWGRVNVGEFSGWVSMRYLEKTSDARWHDLTQPMTCYGTEPFWSARIDPDPLLIGFEGVGATTVSTKVDWTALGYGPDAVSLGMAGVLRKGDIFATLRATSCSDGMSDRVFGIAVNLFVTNAGTAQAYGGCCSLRP